MWNQWLCLQENSCFCIKEWLALGELGIFDMFLPNNETCGIDGFVYKKIAAFVLKSG